MYSNLPLDLVVASIPSTICFSNPDIGQIPFFKILLSARNEDEDEHEYEVV
jgi:hypothetical protein